MISYEHVSFSYANSAAPVLDDVSLQVAHGERVVVLGPNGSGKSTLARLTNGLLLPASGQITVEGFNSAEESTLFDLRSSVGLVAQDPDSQIVATSVADEVAFGPENLGVCREEILSRVDAALDAVGLAGMEAREPHTLSGGQKQRLVIAGVLAMEPRYIIFDEPTSMLDPLGVNEVRSVITELQRQGTGMLHITHDLTDLIGASRAIVLMDGHIAYEGDPLALLADEDLLRKAHLEVPRMLVCVHDLKRAGVKLPANPLDVDAVLEALCRL